MTLSATWVILSEHTDARPTFTNTADKLAYEARMKEIKAIVATRSIEGSREERKAQMVKVDQAVTAMRPIFQSTNFDGVKFYGTIEL